MKSNTDNDDPNLANVLFPQSTHHLLVMNERPIGEYSPLSALRLLSGDLDGPFDSPAETGALGSNYFHWLSHTA